MERKRIIVPFDGSPESRHALGFACRMAAGAGDEIRAVYVIRASRFASPKAPRPWHLLKAEHALMQAHEIARHYGLSLSAVVTVAQRVGPAIVADAWDGDTIIITARRKPWPAGIVHGRVRRYVIAHRPCRVLLLDGDDHHVIPLTHHGFSGDNSAMNRPTGYARRWRIPHWSALLGSLVVTLGVCGITPLLGQVQQAILLGPDSLLPTPSVRTMAMARDGRTVVVAVQAGIVRENVGFMSPALHGRRESYSIYLPPGYSDAGNRRRYPVLYLLHGCPGQPSDWVHGMHAQWMEDQGIAAGRLRPMIMVMPDGNGGVWRDTQYVNTYRGYRAEDLITHDLVQVIDARYRTIPDRRARAIAGISEGGYGAVNLGLKHARIFGTIVSIAGYFSADPAEVVIGNDPWGHDWALMKSNSPSLYVRHMRNLPRVNILIMDNTSDGGYTHAATDFARLLTRYHIAHALQLQSSSNPLVAHYWPYWRQAFPRALSYVSSHLRG